MMKGITNAEIRTKLERIEAGLEQLKQMQKPTNNLSFLGISTICALFGTITFLLTSHPVLLFFMMSGIGSMAFFVGKMAFEKYVLK